jgi:predicted NAD-dependent protein-ADP-ribosyltransferase YbiA (DUF1768 family)
LLDPFLTFFINPYKTSSSTTHSTKRAMLLNHPAFAKYLRKDYKPIYLPAALAEKLRGLTPDKLPMDKFKPGDVDLSNMKMTSTHEVGGNTACVYESADVEKEKQVFAIVVLKGKAFLFYKSFGLTNFRNTSTMAEAEWVTEGTPPIETSPPQKRSFTDFVDPSTTVEPAEDEPRIPIRCNEQLFKGFSASFHIHHPNIFYTLGVVGYEEIIEKILFAPSPGDAKYFTGPKFISPFDKEGWDACSQHYMLVAVLVGLTNRNAYDMLQKICDFVCKKLGLPLSTPLGGILSCFEAAEFDERWGTGTSWLDIMNAVWRSYTGEPDRPTIRETIYQTMRGQNLLGLIYDDVIGVVYGMQYEKFMDQMKGLKVFTTSK